ncbi:MAG: HAD family hydrolase [Spirochaetales bacterium]|nr:HAD family hydrolase [Spirochaetales bacterium]
MKAILSDMDGVLYRGKTLLPGAASFVNRLHEHKIPFLFLTNNSEQTATDLVKRLASLGLTGLQEENFLTSAMATARFLASQKPAAGCYVIGGSGLVNELKKEGLTITETQPDYVVVGKTAEFDYAMLRTAARLIARGAKFIGTNPDLIDPIEEGFEPAAGSLLAALTAATGKKPYIIGKPNALMMLIARKILASHASTTVMIGDRMDTDIVAGLEAGMTTCLVLSGVSTRHSLDEFPYKPDYIFESLADLDPRLL